MIAAVVLAQLCGAPVPGGVVVTEVRRAVVRTGRVRNGALDPATVAQVARLGCE